MESIVDLSQEKKHNINEDVWTREGYYMNYSQQSSGSSQHPSQSTEFNNQVRQFLNSYWTSSQKAQWQKKHCEVVRTVQEQSPPEAVRTERATDQLMNEIKSRVVGEICPEIIRQLREGLGKRLEHSWEVKLELPWQFRPDKDEMLVVTVSGKSKCEYRRAREQKKESQVAQVNQSEQVEKKLRRSTPRVRKSEDQLYELESMFEETWYPDVKQRKHLFATTGLSDGTIRLWFQSRRNRARAEGAVARGLGNINPNAGQNYIPL